MFKFIAGSGIFGILLSIYIGICWVINLIQLFNCDFDAPWKDELIHIIGVFIVPASGITVWF